MNMKVYFPLFLIINIYNITYFSLFQNMLSDCMYCMYHIDLNSMILNCVLYTVWRYVCSQWIVISKCDWYINVIYSQKSQINKTDTIAAFNFVITLFFK